MFFCENKHSRYQSLCRIKVTFILHTKHGRNSANLLPEGGGSSFFSRQKKNGGVGRKREAQECPISKCYSFHSLLPSPFADVKGEEFLHISAQTFFDNLEETRGGGEREKEKRTGKYSKRHEEKREQGNLCINACKNQGEEGTNMPFAPRREKTQKERKALLLRVAIDLRLRLETRAPAHSSPKFRNPLSHIVRLSARLPV